MLSYETTRTNRGKNYIKAIKDLPAENISSRIYTKVAASITIVSKL